MISTCDTSVTAEVVVQHHDSTCHTLHRAETDKTCYTGHDSSITRMPPPSDIRRAFPMSRVPSIVIDTSPTVRSSRDLEPPRFVHRVVIARKPLAFSISFPFLPTSSFSILASDAPRQVSSDPDVRHLLLSSTLETA